jgi:hypothetical protein
LVKGLGKIAISPDHSISNVFLVDSLDYNFLCVSQLCKMVYNCLFTDIVVIVFRRSDDSVAFKGVLEGQLYLVDFNRAELDTCLIAKTNMGWLWHYRLAHVGMKNLHKLLKGEHILGLTNVHFEKNRVCSACQARKQVGIHHPHKNIMTTDRPLELLHMDLFGPVRKNGPRAIWLNEFWCLMINTTCELICLLVFMFIVHRMRRGLDEDTEDATP